MMTGTAGTSQSRLQLETTWSSPVSTGWWTTRRWCCEMAEVDALSPSVLFLTQHARRLTLSCLCVCCSVSASGWQKQPGEAAQTKRAGAEEENLQAGSLETRVCAPMSQPEWRSECYVLRWKEWQPGFPMSIDANRHKDLPRDIQFDSEKGVDFVLNYSKAYVLYLVHL